MTTVLSADSECALPISTSTSLGAGRWATSPQRWMPLRMLTFQVHQHKRDSEQSKPANPAGSGSVVAMVARHVICVLSSSTNVTTNDTHANARSLSSRMPSRMESVVTVPQARKRPSANHPAKSVTSRTFRRYDRWRRTLELLLRDYWD